MNQSWRTYEWVMSHIWMSHVPFMNAQYPTYECGGYKSASHTNEGHDSFLWERNELKGHMRDMTRSPEGRTRRGDMTFILRTLSCQMSSVFIRMSHVTQTSESCIWGTWLVHMTPSSFIPSSVKRAPHTVSSLFSLYWLVGSLNL